MSKQKQPQDTAEAPAVDPEIIEAGEKVVAKREVRAAAIAYLRAADRERVIQSNYNEAAAAKADAVSALRKLMSARKLFSVTVTYEPAGAYGRVVRLLRYDGTRLHVGDSPTSLDDPIIGPEHDA